MKVDPFKLAHWTNARKLTPAQLADRAGVGSNKKHATLHLNAFRGEPAITEFDWPFTPTHNSSPQSST